MEGLAVLLDAFGQRVQHFCIIGLLVAIEIAIAKHLVNRFDRDVAGLGENVCRLHNNDFRMCLSRLTHGRNFVNLNDP